MATKHIADRTTQKVKPFFSSNVHCSIVAIQGGIRQIDSWGCKCWYSKSIDGAHSEWKRKMMRCWRLGSLLLPAGAWWCQTGQEGGVATAMLGCGQPRVGNILIWSKGNNLPDDTTWWWIDRVGSFPSYCWTNPWRLDLHYSMFNEKCSRHCTLASGFTTVATPWLREWQMNGSNAKDRSTGGGCSRTWKLVFVSFREQAKRSRALLPFNAEEDAAWDRHARCAGYSESLCAEYAMNLTEYCSKGRPRLDLSSCQLVSIMTVTDKERVAAAMSCSLWKAMRWEDQKGRTWKPHTVKTLHARPSTTFHVHCRYGKASFLLVVLAIVENVMRCRERMGASAPPPPSILHSIHTDQYGTATCAR